MCLIGPEIFGKRGEKAPGQTTDQGMEARTGKKRPRNASGVPLSTKKKHGRREKVTMTDTMTGGQKR
jgi:hypothetical protein